MKKLMVVFAKQLGDMYITTDSGSETAYVCIKIGADTTGWKEM